MSAKNAAQSVRLPLQHLVLEGDMQTGQSVDLPFGTVCLYSARSPDKSRDGVNEDGAAIFCLGKKSAVLAVADGVGGLPNGAHASEIALLALQESLEREARAGGRIRDAILNGIETANSKILTLAKGSATTIAVAEITPESIRPYHVGDSLILLFGQRGRSKWQTVPHSPVGYLVEGGALEEHEALRDPDANVISNMLGSESMRIEIGPDIPVNARDTLLLATDGLSDNFLTQEIIDRCRKGPLGQAMDRLIADSRDRMSGTSEKAPSKPDDCTFLLFRLAG